jgi:hypothetical protein
MSRVSSISRWEILNAIPEWIDLWELSARHQMAGTAISSFGIRLGWSLGFECTVALFLLQETHFRFAAGIT